MGVVSARYLVDTHALLWFVAGDPSMSANALALVADPNNAVLVSAASAWEIATKYRLGRLPDARLLAVNFPDTIAGLGFQELPITWAAAQLAGGFAVQHKDPFDRMLAAQATLETVPLITSDPAFAAFGIETAW